jgi:hypothetical protein
MYTLKFNKELQVSTVEKSPSKLTDSYNSKLCDFEKWDVGAQTGLIWLRIGTGGRHL